MAVIEISGLGHPGVEIFASLTEAQLRNRLDPANALFIAESPKVIRVALSAGYQPVALMCERRHIAGDAADIIAQCPDMPASYCPAGSARRADGLHTDARRALRHASA